MNDGSRPGASYVQALRGTPQVRRTLLAFLGGLGVLLLVLFVAVVPVGTALDRLLGVESFDPAAPGFSVGFWLAGNLMLAALIPVSGLLQWAIYRERPGWMSSVAGRFRWKVVARAAVIVLPLWSVYMVVLHLVMPFGAVRLTAATLLLVVAAIITVPLQSAGEEYLFRGLLFRAVGARFRRPGVALTVATVVTALSFGVIHGSLDGWTLAYYVLAGVCFALLTQRTGGLEVAVLIHAVNNTLLLVPMILADRLDDLSVASGPVLALPMFVMTLATVALWKSTPRLVSTS
ncbi:CPBP family intramembrane glutamic endopeptidase [Nocardiopsis sp. MG754419]|uniref:CPBP family intramembrane glutamic endopeptidase n=1 Tax=Nocardiopsis sp. MG754419 TaxID=2259865 RepID=UPI001BA65BD8|nr:CPBP family intramembrane glutamic endopeptidase [Nocardiopsis sp. MG754419]MBR8740649.1 CPBP family intramembrane metalloprotease domain-containing protein [Nocardiopsis sp. MG754419]